MKNIIKVADKIKAKHQTCSTVQDLSIVSFKSKVWNKLTELTTEIATKFKFSKLVYHIAIELRLRNTKIQQRPQTTIVLTNKCRISIVKFTERFAQFMVSIALFK